MANKIKIKEKASITIKYDAENALKIFRYIQFIRKKINTGQKIPARVIKKFMKLFDGNDFDSNKDLVDLCVQKTVDRFKNTEYFFEHIVAGQGKSIDLFDNTYIHPVTGKSKLTKNGDDFGFKTMVTFAITKVIQGNISNPKKVNNRDEYIRIAGKCMIDHRKEFLNKNTISDYGIGAIATYISTLLGWSTPKKEPTVSELFQTSRNALNPILKKEKYTTEK